MELIKLISVLAATLPVVYGAPAQTANSLHPDILAAMKRDLGLEADQAHARVAHDLRGSEAIENLRNSMGESFAGGWVEKDAFYVGVTDEAEAHLVTAAGGKPVVVANSLQRLQSAKSAMDELFKTHAEAKSATSATEGIAAFFVSESTNKVVIEALEDEASQARARDLASQAGLSESEYELRSVATMPSSRADILGGYTYINADANLRCSVGFSVRGGFVSAGHCGRQGSRVVQQGSGTYLGYFRASQVNAGDMSYIETNDNAMLYPSVYGYGYGNYAVYGSQEYARGASVCRSGSTTGLRCGYIGDKGITVQYTDLGTMYGLTQTSACSDHGDSGGSFISNNQGQGVLSGGNGNCNSGQSVSYFYPLNNILNNYGLTLLTA